MPCEVRGGEPSAPLRERVLREDGGAVLRLVGPVARVTAMRVPRTAPGVPLAAAGDVLERVLGGEYGGTLPDGTAGAQVAGGRSR